jgi:hypothetical protein
VFHPAQRSSLNTIEVPHTDIHNELTDDPDVAATWTTISNPLLIEERLLARNIKHFGQAQGTLVTTQRLQDLFGYSGVDNTVNHLLDGDQTILEDINLSPCGPTLLNLLSNKGRLSPRGTEISFKIFTSALKKWSEQTSTSPSGRHLGHHKCLFAEDYFNYPEDDPDPSPKILRVYYHIACMALRWGLSLDRWQTSITSMIEKVPGCPKINKLRVIHLYEADYNLLLKIIWAQRLVWNAHDKD